MNPTELAHWRYRVKALESEVKKLEQDFRRLWRDLCLIPGRWQEEVLEFTRWLLEEARYMCELGAAQSEMTRDSTEEVRAQLKHPHTVVGKTALGGDIRVDPRVPRGAATMQGDAGPEYYRHKYLLDLVKWVAEKVEGSVNKYWLIDTEPMLQEFIAEHGRMPR